MCRSQPTQPPRECHSTPPRRRHRPGAPSPVTVAILAGRRPRRRAKAWQSSGLPPGRGGKWESQSKTRTINAHATCVQRVAECLCATVGCLTPREKTILSKSRTVRDACCLSRRRAILSGETAGFPPRNPPAEILLSVSASIGIFKKKSPKKALSEKKPSHLSGQWGGAAEEWNTFGGTIQ